MMETNNYAVFGHPIGHSKSPQIHRLFAEQTGQLEFSYSNQDVPAEEFDAAIEEFFAAGGKGLNCTVPLKELAWRRADRKSDRAELAKAANTLCLQADGSIFADNTDGVGLVRDLCDNHRIRLAGANILVLGAGGASRGILQPLLLQQPSALVIANRTRPKAVGLSREFAHLGPVSAAPFEQLTGRQFDLIINATAASLDNTVPPLPEEGLLADNACCYDLCYGNKPTAFVRWGQQKGATINVDGLGMLVEQAAEAFYLWRGVRPDSRAVIEQLNRRR